MRAPEKLAILSCMALQLAGCATRSINMAPHAPDEPWTAATRPDGEIIAGAPPSQSAPKSGTYVLPSNPKAAGDPGGVPTDLDKSHPYTLPELIDIAQSHNPFTRVTWENARTAALAAGIARAAYLPNLSASVVGAYQTKSNNITLLGNRESGDSSAH